MGWVEGGYWAAIADSFHRSCSRHTLWFLRRLAAGPVLEVLVLFVLRWGQGRDCFAAESFGGSPGMGLAEDQLVSGVLFVRLGVLEATHVADGGVVNVTG